MTNLRRTLAAALLLASAANGFAATPTKHEALQAISVLEKSLVGPEADEAARTIVTYADLSDEVMVDLGPDEIPWSDEKWGLEKERELSCQSMLLAAFVAGNVRSQIKNDRAEDDTYSGWVFAIDAYKRLRANGKFRSPSIESLLKMEAEGTLLHHAKEIQSKEEQADPDGPQKKPLA
ncbi:MAG TPA: hypothetical protein VII43_08060 [Opitutaceae bacterium]